jgi:hypothetical protein
VTHSVVGRSVYLFEIQAEAEKDTTLKAWRADLGTCTSTCLIDIISG